MRKLYKQLTMLAAGILFTGIQMNGQTGCAASSTNGIHTYGCGIGDQIDSFTLNAVAASNAGCASGTGYYIAYSSPVWNLTIGNTYTWAATTGNGIYQQGFALWIDLNNDGFFASSEQLGNSAFGFSHSGSFAIPFTASPGSNVRMRLRCNYYTNIANTNSSACDVYYYGETEDYLVNLISPTPCSGTPGANTAVGPLLGICPNTSAQVGLSTTYTVGDITYQWQSSTSNSVGPYTSIPGGTNNVYTTPTLQSSVWYQAIITCTVSGLQITSAPGLVLVQGTTTNTVPYFEGFEGITAANKLPNCSWMANNLGSQALTYIAPNTGGRVARNGNKFASFYYSPAGTKNFFTNGIWMNAGVTYSATVWFQTEYYGYNNWTDLSILAGPQQNAVSQFTIASTGGNAISAVYKPLTNTFTVATSGLYFVNIRATGTTNSSAQYLSWDDLSIIVPCELNVPAMTITPDQTVCAGANVNITAGGVDTYTWNTGENTNTVLFNPTSSTLYSVMGTSTLSGCPATMQHYVTVNPLPEVGIFAPKTSVCPGGSVVLTAFGANTYAWSNNANTNITVVSPLSTTSYSVYGTNTFGCQGMAMQTIVVHTAPNVQGQASPLEVCPGQAVQLSATGAVSYAWVSSSYYNKSNPATVYPQQTTSYSVTGTDENGCTTTQMVPVSVLDCTGLTENVSAGSVRVFPNPNIGLFTVLVNGKAQIEISDLTGRHVASGNGAGQVEINISHLANGIYYVKVQTDSSLDVIRIVKE